MQSETIPKAQSPPLRTAASRLIDIDEVAEMLAVSARTVRRRVDDGELPRPIYVGRLAKWRVADIEEYIERKFQEANSATGNIRRA